MGAAKKQGIWVFFGTLGVILGVMIGLMLAAGPLQARMFLIRVFGIIAYVLPLAVCAGGFLLIKCTKQRIWKSFQPMVIAVLASWWIFAAEQLSGDVSSLKVDSRYTGELGSALFNMLLRGGSYLWALLVSMLLMSLVVSLIWNVRLKQGVSLFLKKGTSGKTSYAADTAGISAGVLGLLVLTGILFDPGSTSSLLFYLLGYGSWVIPLVLLFICAVTITGGSVFTIVRSLLLVPIFCFLAGSIELLAFRTVSPMPGWHAGGLLGGLPVLFLQRVFPLQISILTVIISAALLLVLLWNVQLRRALGSCRKTAGKPKKKYPAAAARSVNTRNTEEPDRRQTESEKEEPIVSSEVLEKETPLPDPLITDTPQRDEPLPLSLLPDAPDTDDHARNELIGQLDSVEKVIISVVKQLTGITLARAPGTEPVLGLQSMRFSFVPQSPKQAAVKKVLGVAHDLALGVQRSPVQIYLRDTVIMEVPLKGDEREFVHMKGLLQECLDADVPSYLIGRTLEGHPLDLPASRSLNVLIGGQTGSGKSVMLHSIIFGLIFRWKPSEVQLALYDHKVEEFSRYSTLPHLRYPAASSQESFELLLSQLGQELTRRKQMREKQPGCTFPLLVTIMDEFRGLNSSRLTDLIAECRSLQMSFILATQYPRADVISTPIKANLTTGICFRMRDQTGSRLIIGESGGESLMDKGDCLVHTPWSFEHAQGAYCTVGDLEAVSSWLSQEGQPGKRRRGR